MTSFYAYSVEGGFSNEDSLPSGPYRFFNLELRYNHYILLHLPTSERMISIHLNSFNQVESYRQERFLDPQQGPRIITSIFSFLGMPSNAIPLAVSESFAFARRIEQSSTNTNGRDLTMVLNFLVATVYYDDEDIDDLSMEISNLSMEANVPRFRPADKDAIEKLEKVKVQDLESMNQCTICLEKFQINLEVTRMACGHVYHEECIVKWLETSNNCPLCRFETPCSEN